MEDRIPNFMDLMEDWRHEFNKTNPWKYEMYYHDFTQIYTCMKVKRVGEDLNFEHTCIAHLFTTTPHPGKGQGVEFDGTFLRPEDPTFFEQLMQRVEKRLKE